MWLWRFHLPPVVARRLSLELYISAYEPGPMPYLPTYPHPTSIPHHNRLTMLRHAMPAEARDLAIIQAGRKRLTPEEQQKEYIDYLYKAINLSLWDRDTKNSMKSNLTKWHDGEGAFRSGWTCVLNRVFNTPRFWVSAMDYRVKGSGVNEASFLFLIPCTSVSHLTLVCF